MDFKINRKFMLVKRSAEKKTKDVEFFYQEFIK